MKIVKSPEYSGLLLKEVTKAIENERKRERDATQGASLLGNLLSGESIVHAGGEVIRAVNGTKAKKKKQERTLIPTYSLAYLQMHRHFQNELEFKGVYSQNIL